MIADLTNLYTCIADATYDVSQPHKWLPACDIDGSYKAVQCKDASADPRYFSKVVNNFNIITQIACSLFCQIQVLLLQQNRDSHLWL